MTDSESGAGEPDLLPPEPPPAGPTDTRPLDWLEKSVLPEDEAARWTCGAIFLLLMSAANVAIALWWIIGVRSRTRDFVPGISLVVGGFGILMAISAMRTGYPLARKPFAAAVDANQQNREPAPHYDRAIMETERRRERWLRVAVIANLGIFLFQIFIRNLLLNGILTPIG